ncbi:GlsB/YeaQ/YmgE family stress response membrane protein [Candidatus Microgenomates bacterium]|nr:GlsB/YeaQ/YmgE family stress response membrane protein [Candidatus Microgenomates bacterium]
MGILAWIVIGGLAGWAASKVMGTDAEQGVGMNILVGIAGALVGGFLVWLLGGDSTGITGFNLASFLVALLGAVVLLAIVKAVRKNRVA